jgi:hypothetical protein
MRNPDRIPEILQVLGEVWMKYPDLRLGQIIDNARYFNEDGTLRDDPGAPAFITEDNLMLEGLLGILAWKEEEDS